jgi:hypothetical protein
MLVDAKRATLPQRERRLHTMRERESCLLARDDIRRARLLLRHARLQGSRQQRFPKPRLNQACSALLPTGIAVSQALSARAPSAPNCAAVHLFRGVQKAHRGLIAYVL